MKSWNQDSSTLFPYLNPFEFPYGGWKELDHQTLFVENFSLGLWWISTQKIPASICHSVKPKELILSLPIVNDLISGENTHRHEIATLNSVRSVASWIGREKRINDNLGRKFWFVNQSHFTTRTKKKNLKSTKKSKNFNCYYFDWSRKNSHRINLVIIQKNARGLQVF